MEATSKKEKRTITNDDLITEIAKAGCFRKETVKAVLSLLGEVVSSHVANDQVVKVSSLGHFYRHTWKGGEKSVICRNKDKSMERVTRTFEPRHILSFKPEKRYVQENVQTNRWADTFVRPEGKNYHKPKV